MNEQERKIMRALLNLVVDQREEDHKIRTYQDQDEHRIVESAKRLLGMVGADPCDVCGILVRADEYLGYDKPDGETEYKCENCFDKKYAGLSEEERQWFPDDEPFDYGNTASESPFANAREAVDAVLSLTFESLAQGGE